MSGIGRKLAVLAMSGAVVLSLAACNRNNADGESLDGYTAEQIFQRGEYVLENSRRAEDSLHYFREVERLYPYTDWARRSIVMQAYALHREGKYDEARAAAQRFLDQYPGDPDAAWAAYIVALTYYDQIEDVGRDQGLTFQALQHLRYVIETYPNTEYARSAVLKFDLAFDRLAAKEMEIGRYYLARRNYAAAINRFRAVVEQYQKIGRAHV